MRIEQLTRIADLCLAARAEMGADAPGAMRLTLDMTLFEVGREIAARSGGAGVGDAANRNHPMSAAEAKADE